MNSSFHSRNDGGISRLSFKRRKFFRPAYLLITMDRLMIIPIQASDSRLENTIDKKLPLNKILLEQLDLR